MTIILAYSGGLDTSVALHWLREKYNTDVIAYCANVGQAEDLTDVAERARQSGAAQVIVEDLQEHFLLEYAFPAMAAAASYEGRYLLAAPLSRPLIAERMVRLAHEHAADTVAHGATGKGNDQVRFYASIRALDPALKVVAPVIDWDLTSRQSEVEYAENNGVNIGPSKNSPYSIDTNIWGTSIECGKLDDIEQDPPEDAWQITVSPERAPAESETVRIGFSRGIPTSLDGEDIGPVPLVNRLNQLGCKHGAGRADILENRIVGFKSRGAYESPAATILHAGYRDLESLTLDRETYHFKRSVADRYSELVYYGYWFSDLRRALDGFHHVLASRITGSVDVKLYKGSVSCVARRSPYSRYDENLADYQESDTFDHTAGAGFAYAWALPLVSTRGPVSGLAEGE